MRLLPLQVDWEISVILVVAFLLCTTLYNFLGILTYLQNDSAA